MHDPFVMLQVDPTERFVNRERRKQTHLKSISTSVESMLNSHPHARTTNEPEAKPNNPPSGLAWDLTGNVRFLTEKQIDAVPPGALPVMSIKDEDKTRRRANDEWRLQRKKESEAKLKARVEHDEQVARRRYEGASMSHHAQQHRYNDGVMERQKHEYRAAARATGKNHGEHYQFPTISAVKTPSETVKEYKREAVARLAQRQTILDQANAHGIKPEYARTVKTPFAESIAAYQSAATYARHADSNLQGIDRELRLSKRQLDVASPTHHLPPLPTSPTGITSPKAQSISSPLQSPVRSESSSNLLTTSDAHETYASVTRKRTALPNFMPFAANPFVVRHQLASRAEVPSESLELARDAAIFRRACA
jgi:hypothetical protein